MGGFFVYNKTKICNVDPALELFDEMGFTSPKSIEIGEWHIYAFPKMVVEEPNIISGAGYTLVSAGTPIYKGHDYKSSLKSLLMDYMAGSIKYNQLIGQYTILFCHENTITILMDSLGCKHLFMDKNHHMLSSHMLPICQCYDGSIHINRKAFYEKLLTGIIMPPNTMFEEIIQIDKCIATEIAGECIEFIQIPNFSECESHSKSEKQCLNDQIDTLRDYFLLLKNAGKDGIDIGLSGGYDSRLVLACLNRFNNNKIHLHSHSTEKVHQNDLKIANQMADCIGTSCHTVPTKKLNHCEHVDEILRKSILYFDGRSSFSIGGCGEVYTASYRIESTEKTPLTMTGVGGELYRNVFDLGFNHIRFDRFIENKVFSQNSRNAIPQKEYTEIRNDIIKRAAERLGINLGKRQPKTMAHRYYCEIMMPDGQGVALDAYNQVSCCIAPFLEPAIIAKGYEAVPFHHSGGEFEGKLIGLIDPGLASIPSSYGYPIGKRPLKAKIKEKLRTYIPYGIWDKLANVTHKNGTFSVDSALNELYANSELLKEAYEYMNELFPEVQFIHLLHSSEEIRMVQFLAITLYLLKERIKVN